MMLVSLLIYWGILSLVQGLPGAKGYRNSGEVAKIGIQPEPTCEELKAMWRFSKRQSRAAELTNELPMYPDPFAENVWQNYYATSRSIAGRRPVAFGKISYAPSRNRINPEYLMPYLQNGPKTAQPRRRPTTSFRLPGGGNIISNYPPQAGSFDHLKELIKTERARELQQQRLVEENAARAAVMKENGRHQPGYGRYTTDHFSYDMVEPQEILYSADMPDIQENDPMAVEDRSGIIAFPDILAPKDRLTPEISAYSRDHPRMRSHGPNLFDASFFPEEYGGYLL